MDRLTALRAWAGKYKYPLAALLLGVALMLLPLGSSTRDAPAAAEAGSRVSVQSEMESVLAAFEGAGRLRLMLSTEPEGKRWAGAVVVCEGADSAAVRLELTRAVSALTGLGTDRITIVKGRP